LKINSLRLPCIPLAACPFLKLPENADRAGQRSPWDIA